MTWAEADFDLRPESRELRPAPETAVILGSIPSDSYAPARLSIPNVP